MIDGTENTGVERDGVGNIAAILMPCLVCFHYFCVDAVKHNVFVIAEFLEAVESGGVCFGCTDFAVLFQLCNHTLHVVEQGVFVGISVELIDHIVSRVWETFIFEFADDFCQPFDIPTYSLAD